jgi:nicotinamidase-related amidase
MRTDKPALIVIDVQEGFSHPKWGTRNNAEAEQKIAGLLATWREHGWPVFHVKHNSRSATSPLHPTSEGNRLKGFAAPRDGEPLVEKDVNSAFIGTDLEARLRAAGVVQVVMVGLTTPHCISTSARMAGNLDFETFVASDATAAFSWPAHDGTLVPAEVMHFHALAALHGEFATVATGAEIVETVLKSRA